MEECNIKICPRCKAEFYSHVQACSDCGVPLVWPDSPESAEWERAKWESRTGEPIRDPVTLRAGGLNAIMELCDVLKDSGMPCGLRPHEDCGTGGCAATYLLVVGKEHAEEAGRILDAYHREMHPEFLRAEQWIAENRCPACGHPLGADAGECGDCGLVFGADLDE